MSMAPEGRKGSMVAKPLCGVLVRYALDSGHLLIVIPTLSPQPMRTQLHLRA